MASSVWKGYLSFGLLSISIRLFTAARGEHASASISSVEFAHTRIKCRYSAPTCDQKK